LLLGVLFQRLLLVFRGLQAFVGDDSRGGRRAGKFAGAAARLAGRGKFFALGFSFAHERHVRRESAYRFTRVRPRP
jgi:hypothetical protein